jgi:hypothetical protein
MFIADQAKISRDVSAEMFVVSHHGPLRNPVITLDLTIQLCRLCRLLRTLRLATRSGDDMHRPRPRARFVAWSVGWLWALGTIASARGQAQADPPQSSPSNQTAQTTPAAPTSQSTNSAYDAFIEQALQAYDAGRFAEARGLFRRAHEVMPTARTLRTIGMCSFNLGDYADAATSLEAALEDVHKPLTSEQRRQASELIARCSQQIGRFQLRLSPSEATLSVDGRVTTRAGQHELLLDPGRHELTVQARGYRSVESVLNVDGGDHTTLEFHLPPNVLASLGELPAADASQPSAADGRADYASAHRTERSATQSTIGYVSLGIGAAGLVGFGVTSALALVEQHKLNDRCPDTNCAPARFHELDRYDALKVASTATLIGGAAFVLLGTGLLLFQPERLPREQSTAVTTPPSLEPLIGLGSLGVRGRL